MRRLVSVGPFFCLLLGCSVFIRIDEDEYTGGGPLSSVGGDSTGGATTGGTDGGTGNGGTGGMTPTGGLGGEGGDGDGGGTNTGGDPGVELPPARHYYALDGDLTDSGTPDGSDDLLPMASFSADKWVTSGTVSGQALEIDAGDWLQLEPYITGSSPFTLSWWFIVESATNEAFVALASKVINGQGTGGYVVYSENNYINLRVGDLGGQKFGSSAMHSAQNEGTWNHIAFAFHQNISGTQDKLIVWLNGEVAINETVVLSDNVVNTTSYLRFGLQEGAGYSLSNFEGFVDEIRVYKQVLTTEQVQALYQQGAP